jgi:hypothetical protein
MNIIPPTTITDAMLHYSNITEPSPAETALAGYAGAWNSGTTYGLNAIVIYSTTHTLYQSLQDGNVGQTPGAVGASAWWLDYGLTERWCVFDAKVGSQASRAGSITYEIDPGPFDSIALLNIEAESITVTVEDVGGGGGTITWNKTTLADGLFMSDVVKTDFPLTYLTPHLVIKIDYPGETAKVGEIVVGVKESLGSTQYNPAISIIDYSVKETDTFGNYTVLERAYSKRLSCQTIIENTALDATYNILAEHRAVAAVWVGSEEYASMIVYGFYKDFSIEISYPTVSICSLEIEGLV